MLPRRYVLALAAVVDVAIHARGQPVAAKALAARHGLAPRHLEPLLQGLVKAGILRGTRGPHGGYELARERRRISAGDIVRALDRSADEKSLGSGAGLIDHVIAPMIAGAVDSVLISLDGITIETLCRRAEDEQVAAAGFPVGEFHI